MSIFLKSIKAKEINSFNDQTRRMIIDVRSSNEYKSGHIKLSRNVPLEKLVTNPKAFLKSDEQYYIICASGMRSKRACRSLKKQGYTNIINVKGGFFGYEQSKIN